MFAKIIFLTFFGFTITNGEKVIIPEDFKLGTATSAFQVEGAWNTNGKGPSIWDVAGHDYYDLTTDHSNADVACDSYRKWREDVNLLKYLGVNFYRFSISWTRILPEGYTNEINPDGIRYYNELIDELLENGIEPIVTIYHFDLPQSLQYLGGFANYKITEYLEHYARVLFKYFGDRVKTWISINEPSTFCKFGAPLVNSDAVGLYLCGKNMILGHARIYRLYEREFKEKQKGRIGITVNVLWLLPKSNSILDVGAQIRGLEFSAGWWLNPIFTPEGNYPKVLVDRLDYFSKEQNFSQSRLPPFTPEEIVFVRGTADFLGLNYYTAKYVEADISFPSNPPSLEKDLGTILTDIENIPQSGAPWLQVYPEGIRNVLLYIKDKYNNPVVYITENGYPHSDGRLEDPERITFIKSHLKEVIKAKQEGCNVEGYTYWSLMDNFELTSGYSVKFGLVRVDFNSPDRTRTLKNSAKYYKELIQTRVIDD